MEGHSRYHQYHGRQQLRDLQQRLYHHQNPPSAAAAPISVDAGDRFPQWGQEETREFLMIRAELDRAFMETKRNKGLWDVTAKKMSEKGYHRTAEQCKSKWKNLVTRYKGYEAMEPDATKQLQFPFYNELQMIYTSRIERVLWAESDTAGGASTGTRTPDSETAGDHVQDLYLANAARSKRLKIKGKGVAAGSEGSGQKSLVEVLEEFMKRQVEMEEEWREAYERREKEREDREREWRRRAEELERERLAMERRWMEMEEERRAREAARAPKRDALIDALLNKLSRDHQG